MLVGDVEDGFLSEAGPCGFCPGGKYATGKWVYASPNQEVVVYPHPHPLYQIEGAEARAAEGIYDRMRTVGAHEVVAESRTHDRGISGGADVSLVLTAFASRISDLKRDKRFRYITVFKNKGPLAGEEFGHAHSQITATAFIPRRMVYELRASRQHFQVKERCVFCDIVQQEEERGTRVVEATANYFAMCPFASRVPYELWVLPRYHAASFEQDLTSRGDPTELAGILKRSLARVQQVAEAYHMVLHTTPNTSTQRGLTPQWITLADDYHWHFEILPITEKRTRSYSIKEVYYSPVTPESAAVVLREAQIVVT